MNTCIWATKFPVRLLHRVQVNKYLVHKPKIRTFYINNHLSASEKGQPFKVYGTKEDATVNNLHYNVKEQNIRNKNSLYYLSAFTILVGGCTYMSVLLYRIYCQSTGKGGQAILEEAGEKIASMTKVKNRTITVNFNADLNSSMMWNFKPQQPFIKVAPGETALAFYTAKNPTNKTITGVATYNVVPFEAGKYFNKIQCFCFEEQQLNPHEEVDMPVFFYLDPEYAEDPFLEKINDIVLSYTFFEAKEGMQLPKPSFM